MYVACPRLARAERQILYKSTCCELVVSQPLVYSHEMGHQDRDVKTFQHWFQAMDTLQFILLDVSAPLIKEWQHALTELIPTSFQNNFSIVQSKLADLKAPNNRFDCIVSPANSYGRLDGG